MDELRAKCDEVDAESRSREGSPDAQPEFERLARTIWRLRQPDGCPWDRDQTHASISSNMIEEAYEALDSMLSGDAVHLREELGDVLMQVLLHAQIAADEGEFTLEDVCCELNEKLVRRHPHVFGDISASDADEALASWDEIKRQEREGAGEEAPGLLDSVPASLPALMECQKVSKRAAKCGFEWDSVEDVWDKVAEEKAEFLAEERGSAQAEMEFGDLLFALVNVARHEGIDAEAALRAANAKFRRRWAAMERMARKRGIELDALTTEELNVLWDEVKAR